MTASSMLDSSVAAEAAVGGPRTRRLARRVDATSTNERRRTLRAARYEAQRVLWRVTKIRRFAYCGRVVVDKSKGVSVRVTGTPGTPEARAGFSGLQSCGSVWSCPVCSEKVNARRQSDLEVAIEKWVANGGAVVFGTLTVRHNASQALAALWDVVAPSWTKVISGKAWHGGKDQVGDRERFGVAGWARLVEVKHGVHGWHPHIHALFFLDEELDDQALEEFRGRLFGRWSKVIGQQGLTAMEFDQDGKPVGVDLRRVTDADYIAEYFAKNGYHPAATSIQGAAYEVTGSQSKRQGKGGRTPFQVLADVVVDQAHAVDREVEEVYDPTTGEIVETKTTADLRLWWEWEQTSRGRRQLTWSKSIRDLVGLDAELTDEEVVEQSDLDGTEVSLIGALMLLGEQPPQGVDRDPGEPMRSGAVIRMPS